MPNGETQHILAVENPVCSHHEIATAIIDCLRNSRWGGQLEVLQTGPPDEVDNVQLIQDELRAGTIVISLGGDGHANDVVNAMWRAQGSGQIGADDVRAKLCATGKGNDSARSLSKRSALKPRNIVKSLEQAETARLDIMEVRTSDGLFDRAVLGYVGFGFTGDSAVHMNQPDFRERQRQQGWFVPDRAQDAIEVLKAVWHRQPFDYQNGSVEVAKAQEILLALMPRVAAGVIRMDTEPFDGKVVSLQLDDRAFILKALGVVGRRPRLSGRANGRPLDIEDQHELTFLTDTTMQYDGEPYALDAGTKVSIAHRREVIPVLV